MSGGLYSMDKRDFDKTLDLKKVKPYGDTMNDGKVQLSFTLPVPCNDEAIEAAKQLLKKLGFENPQVVYYKELTQGFTFFNCYGTCKHTVDFSSIHVPKVESTKMSMKETIGVDVVREFEPVEEVPFGVGGEGELPGEFFGVFEGGIVAEAGCAVGE